MVNDSFIGGFYTGRERESGFNGVFGLNYYIQKKIRYIADPYQGSGNDAIASLMSLPSEKLHLELSFIYSDFTRDPDSQKEYDYTIIRSKNTFQINKYLFFRVIMEHNSFRKRLMTDFLACFSDSSESLVDLSGL